MSTRIHLFDADGNAVITVTPSMLEALIESGILSREETPAAPAHPLTPPSTDTHLCIHSTCMQPREIGAFCASCFEHLRVFEPGFAEAWYREWPEALRIYEALMAERMVSA